jgi:hypothetical protein
VLVQSCFKPADEDLDAGGALGIADQPVGQPECAAVGGAGLADADVCVAGAAEVLDTGERPGRQDPEAAVHQAFASTKRTRTPG